MVDATECFACDDALEGEDGGTDCEEGVNGLAGAFYADGCAGAVAGDVVECADEDFGGEDADDLWIEGCLEGECAAGCKSEWQSDGAAQGEVFGVSKCHVDNLRCYVGFACDSLWRSGNSDI